jgi:small-conductance mechanosensitive channel/CRP-like cAMP-binding protein
MTLHPLWGAHFFWAIALTMAASAAMILLPDPTLRRRLRATAMVAFTLVVLHLSLSLVPSPALAAHAGTLAGIESVLLALALINSLVTFLFYPWLGRRTGERTPSIVQDTLVVMIAGAFAAVYFGERVWAASFGAAAAIALALQEQLGNLFAGLAIQVEKPFRVGHWIRVGEHDGRVIEVTWRATKVRTKAGNLVVIPNQVVAAEPISNFSEPIAPTREFVEVGASYSAQPNDVKTALLAAMSRVGRVLTSPPPDVLLTDFGASAIVYRARYWLDDFEANSTIAHEVRTSIYYEFQRRGIEIPFPIQVEYSREEPADDPAERTDRLTRVMASVPVFAVLAPDAHRALAASAVERVYGDGEAIVREGEPGRSMFVVRRGRVAILAGTPPREVAVTEAGGYFGEMSLLTGDARTATVVARGDCTVAELDADAFGAYVRSHPDVVDLLATAAAARRRELDQSRAATTTAPVEARSMAQRIRKFFRLGT